MIVLGLTGPSGSGKGALCHAFLKRGVPSLDTDAVYHAIVGSPSPCTKELADTFGAFVLDENGAVNRPALAKHVFCGGKEEKERLTVLNRITHRYVLDAARLWLAQQAQKGYKAAIIDAPLLYESGFDRECDAVIAILAPREVRQARIMLRDAIDVQKAQARIAAQQDDCFYTSRAKYVVINDRDTEHLSKEAENILRALGIE